MKPKEGKTKRPSTCKHCNKKLSKKKWYYRNGNYFCSKKCWKEFDKKQREEAQKKEG